MSQFRICKRLIFASNLDAQNQMIRVIHESIFQSFPSRYELRIEKFFTRGCCFKAAAEREAGGHSTVLFYMHTNVNKGGIYIYIYHI